MIMNRKCSKLNSCSKILKLIKFNIEFTGVRLKVEHNQLVGACWRFGWRVIELQGA